MFCEESPLIALQSISFVLTSRSYNNIELSKYLKQRTANYSAPMRYDEVLYVAFVRNAEDHHFLEACEENLSKSEQIASAVASDIPVGQIFFFDYGVTVIWGLCEIDEKAILREIIPFETDKTPTNRMHIESFQFYHSLDKHPKLFNDIISLRSGGYLTKLTISHAIGQSVKLALYEDLIDETISKTKHIPLYIAQTGTVPYRRTQVTKYIGHLFITKINVNLVSNVLDTPEFFWYEPTHVDLYRTVRKYLELDQRIEVLNQRCNVIADLLLMLREHLNNSHGETLEWIVIILIVFEVVVGITTVCIDLLK